MLFKANPLIKAEEFQSWVKIIRRLLQTGATLVIAEAPDQNRTDTSSLEGYGSTIELQAHKN
jgi:hypothetical protein